MNKREDYTVLLNIKLYARTIYGAIEKLDSFSKMLEMMSKEKVVDEGGTTRLDISTEMFAYATPTKDKLGSSD